METKLANLAKSSEQPGAPQTAEAIAANVEAKRWQLSEIESGIKELDKGKGVDHADVQGWLQSWGKI